MNILSVYACRLTGKYMAEKNVINNCTNLETFFIVYVYINDAWLGDTCLDAWKVPYNHVTSNLAIYSHETSQDKKHKMDSLLFSSSRMTNYMKSCSFLRAHFFE